MKIKWGILMTCVCLTACSMPVPTVTPTANLPARTSTPRNDPSDQIPTETPQTEGTEVVTYEVISPESINTEGGVVITFNGATIEIHPVMGTLFRLGFRYSGLSKDQIPETRWEYVDPPFIVDLQIFRGVDEVPIRLDVGGAGGGPGITEDGPLIIGQSQTYQFPDDFVAGEVEHIVVLVTFHEMFGISVPVRYELDLVPLEGPLG